MRFRLCRREASTGRSRLHGTKLTLLVLVVSTKLVDSIVGKHKPLYVDLVETGVGESIGEELGKAVEHLKVGLAEVDDLAEEHVCRAVTLQKLAESDELVSLLLLLLHSFLGHSDGTFLSSLR